MVCIASATTLQQLSKVGIDGLLVEQQLAQALQRALDGDDDVAEFGRPTFSALLSPSGCAAADYTGSFTARCSSRALATHPWCLKSMGFTLWGYRVRSLPPWLFSIFVVNILNGDVLPQVVVHGSHDDVLMRFMASRWPTGCVSLIYLCDILPCVQSQLRPRKRLPKAFQFVRMVGVEVACC